MYLNIIYLYFKYLQDFIGCNCRDRPTDHRHAILPQCCYSHDQAPLCEQDRPRADRTKIRTGLAAGHGGMYRPAAAGCCAAVSGGRHAKTAEAPHLPLQMTTPDCPATGLKHPARQRLSQTPGSPSAPLDWMDFG